MSIKNQDEKINNSLIKFGNTLKEQREIVFKIDVNQFVDILNKYSTTQFTVDVINNMEKGKSVDIIYWMTIWLYFQNLDKILLAYDAKEMMFLASQNLIPNIEEIILKQFKKKPHEE